MAAMPIQRLAVPRQGPAPAADNPAVEPGLPSGGGGCAPWLMGVATYLAPQLCDTPVGKSYGIVSRDSSSSGTCEVGNDRAVYAGRRQPHPGGDEPARPADAFGAGHGSAADLSRASRGPPAPWSLRSIFRKHGSGWRAANRGHMSLGQLKVMSAIETCRTAALGGHVSACENQACGHMHIAYNSCRINRHCPKCQGAAARDWLEARQAELLPVQYFHQVFTIPAALADIAYQNKGGDLRHSVQGLSRNHAGYRGR